VNVLVAHLQVKLVDGFMNADLGIRHHFFIVAVALVFEGIDGSGTAWHRFVYRQLINVEQLIEDHGLLV
jgi:hypothetical protein